MAFSGYTFPYQKTPPSGDAMVRAAALHDGILNGCALTHSGFSVTMAAGHILANGRTVRHDASDSWSVSGAVSGFARVVMTIDLSKTSTATSFTMISSDVDYAASLEEFGSLRQDDLNDGGTIYQVELCVVALSSGGVANIVRQLGPAAVRSSSEILIVDEIPDLTGVPDGTVFFLPMQVLE